MIRVGICSYCRNDFFNCRCDTFHPIEEKVFKLNKREVEALLDYFYKRAGYISAEFDPMVLNIIKRMDNET